MKFRDIEPYIIFFLCCIGYYAIIHFAWMFGRDVNYTLSYEDQVRETVIEMVKEDSLK